MATREERLDAAEDVADRGQPAGAYTPLGSVVRRPTDDDVVWSAPFASAIRLPGILRVLVLFHESQALGAGTSVVRVLDELGEYGWSASGWFPGDGPLVEAAAPKLHSLHTARSPLAWSVRGWREDPGVVGRLRRTPRYLRALEDALLRTRPHVVHANTLLTLPEAMVARRCGLPVVLQGHELPLPTMKRSAVAMLAARTADVLVGVSDAVSALLRRRAGHTPVLTVRNGVPPASQVGPPTGDAFTVGTIGTVSRVKGTDVFLRAAGTVLERAPDIRFEHVGPPNLHRDAGLDEEIARLLMDEKLSRAVKLLGEQPGETALTRWSVFVSTSRSDGFPLATLEAMAAGLPVIATDVGGVGEQIEHLVNGVLVRPGDETAIAKWILELRGNPDLRARLGQEAARRVQEEFPLSQQASGLHRAYLAALGLRFGPPAVRREIRASL